VVGLHREITRVPALAPGGNLPACVAWIESVGAIDVLSDDLAGSKRLREPEVENFHRAVERSVASDQM